MYIANINKAQASEEANEKQLQLANAQGDAYQYALQEMAFREADDGRQKQVGDYMIAYAIEEAEGMYMPTDSGLEWHNPADENAHIEISVSDAADGRFVPYLTVKVTLFDMTRIKSLVRTSSPLCGIRGYIITVGTGKYLHQVSID